ncbi:hypothetical protein THAOC_36553, partial [Thalassiosira oceanica]
AAGSSRDRAHDLTSTPRTAAPAARTWRLTCSVQHRLSPFSSHVPPFPSAGASRSASSSRNEPAPESFPEPDRPAHPST